ncbi:MAG TPA: hypothetical protein VNT52_01820, partial [Acidimicrobiales bacterium]|nr:hypothetical protein [Acidimicrobiales bacterium]
MSETIRRLSFAILVLLAVAVPLGLAPDKPDTDRYGEAVRSSLGSAELAEDRASGAPQQAVVNGWVARDLLAIQVQQNNDMLTYQHTIATLLVVLIGALAWVGFAISRPVGPKTQPLEGHESATIRDETIESAPMSTADAK